MIGFARSVYRVFFEIWLWVVLVGATVAGAVMRYEFFGRDVGYGILGFIAGAIAGILHNVYVGGLIAAFLNMDENLERLADGGYRP